VEVDQSQHRQIQRGMRSHEPGLLEQGVQSYPRSQLAETAAVAAMMAELELGLGLTHQSHHQSRQILLYSLGREQGQGREQGHEQALQQ
jgi:predicted transcriptional regulator